MTTAFISKGKLFLLSADGKAEEVHSEFASKQEREAERRHSYSPWTKDNGSSSAFGGVNVWAGHAAAARFAQYFFTEVARIDENTLLYTMTNGTVTGLFEYDLIEKTERRLVHRNELYFLGMDYDPGSKLLCAGRTREDGAAHLEFVDLSGRTTKHLTEGDSVDCFPSFSLRNRAEILFQSSGIARTEDGAFHSHGPACINRIQLETGELTEIIADEQYDFLTPREDKEGAVYCIRRPLQSARKVPLWKSLVDFIMAPVYFAQALYNFLKVFTQLFKNQPTMADGPPLQPAPQRQYMNVLGQVVDLGKARATKKGEEASLVPKDWELVKIVPAREPEVLARGVCSFDIDPSGAITHTNGFKIRTLAAGNDAARGSFEIVEKLRCL